MTPKPNASPSNAESELSSSLLWEGSSEVGSAALQATVLRYLNKYPWADGDAIETNLALTLAFMAVKDALTDYLRPFGLSLTRAEYNFLAILHLADDKQRPLSDIAREMSCSPTYVTKLLNSLEAEGLVERVTSRQDRRVAYAHLTAMGEERCEKLVPTFLKFMGEVGKALTPEQRVQLRHLLQTYKEFAESIVHRPY